jgi:hypothetical protein
MKPGYDQKLFNKLYKETDKLRRSLAYQIDSRRFGVDHQEVLSWFTTKFLYTFNKYWGTMDDDRLKGYIINSLQTFKFRIMREAYSKKNANFNNRVELDEVMYSDNFSYDHIILEDRHEELLNRAFRFLRDKLTDDGLLLLDIQLNTPRYILSKIEDPDKPKITSIPEEVIADYLGLPVCGKVINYIKDLKKEIKLTIEQAREHFKETPIN